MENESASKRAKAEVGDVERATTTEGLPVAPSLGVSLEAVHIGARAAIINGRALMIIFMAVVLGVAAGFIAEILRKLIDGVTNLAFFHRLSVADVMPAEAPHIGWWIVPIPIVGGIIVGLMARYGSRAIRGHGIPEAMEQVLTNESRIPPRITWLKPLSAAVAIGTGGPFGAEGPIIATGGALGSFLGQIFSTTSDERKTLLAAGAAAGMAATFGSPVSAVLLAVELLLFEFRPRSLIPTALAACAATGVRLGLRGSEPVFAMSTDILAPGALALAMYVLIGGVIGLLATLITRAVYWVEDLFEHLPVHWMWWPAIGGLAVGVVGVFAPLTLGVGYSNITNTLNGKFTLNFLAILVVAKFISWVIALGSGTSGGTLAPLFTIGGGAGMLLGAGVNKIFPGAGVDLHVAALVGMAATFAGSARAMLTSVVFAFETTLQPLGLLPLLGGCSMSYLVSCFLMRNTIMTEKIERRGVRVPAEYEPDFLDLVAVKDAATRDVVALPADRTLQEVRAFLASSEAGTTHQGFPLVNEEGHVRGVLTRRDLLHTEADASSPIEKLLRRPPVVVYDDVSLREAADHMLRHDVGRLPVISRTGGNLVGILTRADVLGAHRRRLRGTQDVAPANVRVPFFPRG